MSTTTDALTGLAQTLISEYEAQLLAGDECPLPSGGSSIEVIDALDSIDTEAALSANMGRYLAESVVSALTAMGSRIDEKADIESPVFSGNPSLPVEIPLGASNDLLVNAGFVRDVTRYSFIGIADTTYSLEAVYVTPIGRIILEFSNPAFTDCTIPTPTSLGVTAGDSVNVSITGAYAAQKLLAGSGATLVGNALFSFQHETKTLIAKDSTTWKVVGG